MATSSIRPVNGVGFRSDSVTAQRACGCGSDAPILYSPAGGHLPGGLNPAWGDEYCDWLKEDIAKHEELIASMKRLIAWAEARGSDTTELKKTLGKMKLALRDAELVYSDHCGPLLSSFP